MTGDPDDEVVIGDFEPDDAVDADDELVDEQLEDD